MLGDSYFMAGVFEWVQFVVDKRNCWVSAEVGTLLRAFLDILCKLWEENEQRQLLDKFSWAKRRFSSEWRLEKIQRKDSRKVLMVQNQSTDLERLYFFPFTDSLWAKLANISIVSCFKHFLIKIKRAELVLLTSLDRNINTCQFYFTISIFHTV